MKRFVFTALVSLTALGPLAANALYLEDLQAPFVYLNGSDGYRSNNSHTVVHDFSDYIPDSYKAVSGSLWLAFADDASCYSLLSFFSSCGDSREDAVVKLDFSFYDSHEVDGSIWSYDWQHYLLNDSFELGALNDDGLLHVTVRAREGDFWWKKSWLEIYAEPVSVPTPGALTLLGSGLLMTGIASRRRRKLLATHSG